MLHDVESGSVSQAPAQLDVACYVHSLPYHASRLVFLPVPFILNQIGHTYSRISCVLVLKDAEQSSFIVAYI